MSRRSDSSIEQLEEQLEGAARTLSSMLRLDRGEAERVAERMDRLASQLLSLTEPPSMANVHEGLGTEPLNDVESRPLLDEMAPPDGEG